MKNRLINKIGKKGIAVLFFLATACMGSYAQTPGSSNPYPPPTPQPVPLPSNPQNPGQPVPGNPTPGSPVPPAVPTTVPPPGSPNNSYPNPTLPAHIRPDSGSGSSPSKVRKDSLNIPPRKKR